MYILFAALLLGVLTFLNILAPVSGSATVTPLLAGLVGAKDAIAIATLFFLLTCIPRVFLFRKDIRWDIVRLLWPVSIIGALSGGVVFAGISEALIALIIMGFLLWFLTQKLRVVLTDSSKSQKKPTKYGVTFVGVVSGALQGTGLAGSDLRNSYLLSRGLSMQALHGTTAIIGGSNFLFASSVRVTTGELTWSMAWPILLLFPVIVVATYLGRHITFKMSKQWQDRAALAVMFAALLALIGTIGSEL